MDRLRQEGIALVGQGRFAEAIDRLQSAVVCKPGSAELQNDLGVALAAAGRYVESLLPFQRATRLRPNFPDAFRNRGKSLLLLGRPAEAIEFLVEALRLKPGWADAHDDLGNALRSAGRLAEAENQFRWALHHQPQHFAAWNNLGVALAEQGKLAEAAQSYEQALRLKPASAETHNNLAVIQVKQGRLDEALAYLQKAVHYSPAYGDAWQNLGTIYWQAGKLNESEQACRQGLHFRPNSADLWNQLGLALLWQAKHAEAETCIRKCLEIRPDHADAFNNLGILCEQLGRLDEALAAYQESLRLKPQAPAAHRNLAMLWLRLGDFERGWAEYEWRWQCVDHDRAPQLAQPRWNGEPLNGRRILLIAELGLGDTLQFIRYAPLVQQQGGYVSVACPAALAALLARTPGIDLLVGLDRQLPAFDVYAPLLSLPAIMHTTLATIPAQVPYVTADPRRIKRWGEELKNITGFKIGIAWQGSPKYLGDRHRSIPLEQFAPLAETPGVQLISLQKGFGSEQLEAWSSRWNILDLGRSLDENSGAFMDTAAVMANLDLVVTSDTALAHLAGALGVPVWLPLPLASDWRWLTKRDDSPWYPTMRLFRQTAWGDWRGVFERLAGEVRQARAAR